MIEILKVIVLACQVNSSGTGFDHLPKDIDKYQNKCRQQIMNCIAQKVSLREWNSYDLKACLRERKIK